MPYTPNPEEMDDNQVAADISEFMAQACAEDAPPAPPVPPRAPQQPHPNPQPRPAAKKPQSQRRPAPQHRAAPQHKSGAKRRPKRKKTYNFFGLPQILSTAVWLAMILFIGVTMGRFLWVCAADVLAFGRDDKTVTVQITEEDNMGTIIQKLQEKGLIRYPWLFQVYADLTHAEEDIELGTFSLNTNYDYHALVNELSSSGSREEITVQIPDGYNCRQIFDLLEKNGVATVESLEEFAANGELSSYWFLETVERGDKYCLEGFLFPDTYNFYKGGGAEHAISKLLNGFNNKFNEDLQNNLTELNSQLAQTMRANGKSDSYVVENMFTVREVMIVASLIEKEAASAAEAANIASVIYNRLFNWGSNPRYLNIDAAIVYVTGNNNKIDTSINSPYNTYLNAGLTPTPIANPGMSSIEAALNPANTNYYYYVLNPESGSHVFASSYDEHAANVAKFSGG